MTDTANVLVIVGPDPALSTQEVKEIAQQRRILVLTSAWEAAHRWGLRPTHLIGPTHPIPLEILTSWRQQGTSHLLAESTHPLGLLEIGLNFAITTGAWDIHILGLLHLPWQDALARLLLLARPAWAAARLHFRQGREVGYIVRYGEGTRITAGLGEAILLLPLSPKLTGVTTQGLTPIVRGATLDFGHVLTFTQSEEQAHILIGGGTGLLMWSLPKETGETRS